MTTLPVHRPEARRTAAHRPAVQRAAVLALAASLAVGVAACGDDDDAVDTGASSTTAPASTTTESDDGTTTSDEPATSSTEAPAEAPSTAVFPVPGGDTYDDPVEVATAFATELVGFDDPIVGEFRQGDSTSGEVPVQPDPQGPETTILVRSSGDTWWVVGAASAAIVLTTPAVGDTVTSPMALAGEAWTFEGNVVVDLWVPGGTEPIGSTYVTGGGDMLRPFEGSLTFTAPEDAPYGILVLRSLSAEDGSVWEAGVVRVEL